MFDRDKGTRDEPMGEVRVPVSKMDGQERSYMLQPTKGTLPPSRTHTGAHVNALLWYAQDVRRRRVSL
jgi:hypothetical protein